MAVASRRPSAARSRPSDATAATSGATAWMFLRLHRMAIPDLFHTTRGRTPRWSRCWVADCSIRGFRRWCCDRLRRVALVLAAHPRHLYQPKGQKPRRAGRHGRFARRAIVLCWRRSVVRTVPGRISGCKRWRPGRSSASAVTHTFIGRGGDPSFVNAPAQHLR